MPDITLCKGEGCKIKETCYRFKAKPSEYQAYFVVSPIKYDKCDYFAQIWTKPKKK